MKPRRTPNSTACFELAGGNEDNWLWLEQTEDSSGSPCLRSVWVPTDAERKRIAAGENIYLLTWGSGTPPLSMGLTDEPIGARA